MITHVNLPNKTLSRTLDVKLGTNYSGGVQNIARIGVASQDSTHMTGRAWKAIDGNTLSHYFEYAKQTLIIFDFTIFLKKLPVF